LWCGAYLSNECIFMAWYLVKYRDNFTFCILYLYRYFASVFTETWCNMLLLWW